MKSIRVFLTTHIIFGIGVFFRPTYSVAETKDDNSAANYSLSGNAQFLSHYIVKGLSYSDNNPAMNASFLAHLGSQVKMGFWGSNVSNLSAADDNFWFKLFIKMEIEFSDKVSATVFLHDNHFYKSSQRNGQNIGVDFNYKSYEFGFEWLSNYEGTKTNSEYFWFGKLYDYKKSFKFGGYSGLNYTHTPSIQNFFDFKVVGQYALNLNTITELGLTFNSNSAQFGIRDDPAIYAAIKLSY